MKLFLKVIAVVLCVALIFPMYAFGYENVLTVVTPPARPVFYEGLDWIMNLNEPEPYGDFKLDGLVLDYSGEEIEYEKTRWGPNIFCYSVSGKWTVGENNVYYIPDDYDNLCASGKITFCRIKSVEIVQLPYDTTYIRGVDWDYGDNGKIVFRSRKMKMDGIKLKVVCTDNYTYYVDDPDQVQWSLAADDYEFRVGHNQICALFAGVEVPFDIDIELESITTAYRNHAQSKTLYDYGTDWVFIRNRVYTEIDLSGLTVTAKYNNGTQQVFSYDESPELFSVPENLNIQPGNNSISVLFDSDYPITVNTFFCRYGDADIDGAVNSNDALYILKYAVGTIELSEMSLKYADVNDDGMVNSADALQILNKSVGLIDLFDAEI